MWPPSRTFWTDDFPLATENGVKPFLFKALIPQRLAGEAIFAETFRDGTLAAAYRTGSAKARVYINEDRREDLLRQVIDGQIGRNEDVEAYIRRVTGEARFGFVVNNLERVSHSLAEELGLFLSSMFAVRGIPIGGVEQVSFAGNYSSTAFGIHEGFEHAFLCHFGPGTKHFYCWSQQTYLKLSGGSRSPTFGDFMQWLQFGELFIMEPGDVLYLPARVYHVGRQSEYSLSVALPLYTYPLKRFIAKVIVPSLLEDVPFEEEGMSNSIPVQDVSPFHDDVAQEAKGLFDHWSSSAIRLFLDQYLLKLVSNGGWEIINKPVEDFDNLLSCDVMKDPAIYALPEPYRALWQRGLNCGEDEVRVFVRGESKVFKAEPFIMAFLETQQKPTMPSQWMEMV
ncbi:cupin domain-containing protein [Rhizobium laguerreae]|uniref:cupin domain-containing protein n=1 Tax=Rhizobium laguerreae TaxID=1076926 RepID=UPI001C9188C6|nr:cupin domain-containing protein [Rhizobium laguerreae]MBY3220945.1 hypothetical protein [Rhizobium laguerreae]